MGQQFHVAVIPELVYKWKLYRLGFRSANRCGEFWRSVNTDTMRNKLKIFYAKAFWKRPCEYKTKWLLSIE